MVAAPDDRLTQDEIDTLLAALQSDTNAARQPASQPEQQTSVRPYDFRRSDKLSKEQLRALRMMHESMGRRTAVSLSAYLRTTVDIILSDIDQGTYATFLSQTIAPAIYNLVSLKPLQGQLILEISASLADIVIDRLLGGPGRAWKHQREFTDLELSLLRGVVDRILSGLAEAWSAVFPVEPHVEETLLNLYFVQISLLSDTTVWIVFEVRVGEVSGHLRLGIPYALLKPISAKLSPQAWIAGTEAVADASQDVDVQHLRTHLQDVPVTLVAILGEVDTTFEEIYKLKPGDLIPLDTAAGQDVKILVEGVHCFWARPGIRGNRLAFEVTRILSEPRDGFGGNGSMEAHLGGNGRSIPAERRKTPLGAFEN